MLSKYLLKKGEKDRALCEWLGAVVAGWLAGWEEAAFSSLSLPPPLPGFYMLSQKSPKVQPELAPDRRGRVIVSCSPFVFQASGRQNRGVDSEIDQSPSWGSKTPWWCDVM